MSEPTVVTDDNFAAEVLESDSPVLVDFWATWCGPCKTLGPALEALATEYAGAFELVKVDVDQKGELRCKRR